MIRISKYYPFVLGIFHVIGITLFVLDSGYARLSYVTLLLTGLLLLLSEQISAKKAIAYSSIFIGGFLIELIGTKTSLLFGSYQYGKSLGFSIAGVPIIIGLNWLIIVISSVSIVRRLKIEHHLVCAFLSALLCVVMDYLIEPVAIQYDMWSWNNDGIPLYNYICWFAFSFVFTLIYIRQSKKYNNTGVSIYIIWSIFFLILNLI